MVPSHLFNSSLFDFAFPILNKVYFSNKVIKGEDAVNWSLKLAEIDQCQILQPLYDNLSSIALDRLNKIVKGEGILLHGIIGLFFGAVVLVIMHRLYL